MNIQIVNLTEENLTDAPEWSTHPFSCKYCIYWEYPEQHVDQAAEEKAVMIQRKLAWLKRVNTEWGDCGKIGYLDRQPIAYAQYAPPDYLPIAADYDSGPASDDAVLVSCLFIPDKRFRRMRIGAQLLHSIVAELRQRKEKAMETFARKGSSDNPSGPVEFYLVEGFRIFRDDKEFPLVRLDL
jgi:GNAT superfamily N-acetyltransferase